MTVLKVHIENQKKAMVCILVCGVRYYYDITADLTAMISAFINDRFFKNIF